MLQLTPPYECSVGWEGFDDFIASNTTAHLTSVGSCSTGSSVGVSRSEDIFSFMLTLQEKYKFNLE